MWHADLLLDNNHEITIKQLLLSNGSVARQWLSSHHVGTLTATNAITALQQRNSVFCAVRAKML
jgi:hypothetical protein